MSFRIRRCRGRRRKATHAAHLTPVREEEVLVAGFLETCVEIGAERIASGLGCAMPRDRVLLGRVIRRQVEPATEPPDRLRRVGARDEHAQVHVRGGRVRVARVNDHERETASKLRPRAPDGARSRAAGIREPFECGEVHRSFLDDGPPSRTRPRESAAGLVALLGEVRTAILCLERAADAVLEVEQKIADRGYGRELHAHSLARLSLIGKIRPAHAGGNHCLFLPFHAEMRELVRLGGSNFHPSQSLLSVTGFT